MGCESDAATMAAPSRLRCRAGPGAPGLAGLEADGPGGAGWVGLMVVNVVGGIVDQAGG